jgi:hypothetical protein
MSRFSYFSLAGPVILMTGLLMSGFAPLGSYICNIAIEEGSGKAVCVGSCPGVATCSNSRGSYDQGGSTLAYCNCDDPTVVPDCCHTEIEVDEQW